MWKVTAFHRARLRLPYSGRRRAVWSLLPDFSRESILSLGEAGRGADRCLIPNPRNTEMLLLLRAQRIYEEKWEELRHYSIIIT